ncbi:MAG: hypothetical protein ABJL64_00090 [Rhizobiaceae bacterium]
MKLIIENLHKEQKLECDGRHNALYVSSGRLSVAGKSIAAGEGIYVGEYTDNPVNLQEESNIVRFVVDQDPKAGRPTADGQIVLESRFELAPGDQFLRLDQIDFPPGACAYRHVHPGAGIRFLTQGVLDIESDHGVEQMSIGSAWFEDTNAPVRATASQSQATAFVRAMVLPIEYLGKRTITYLDPSDDDKPRMQTNSRFFDQPVEF